METSEVLKRSKMLLCGSSRNKQFDSFSKVYTMTTENIKGYFECFDLIDKDVLTVCSSGDHIFSAFYRGAKKVDCFDINVLTEYYYHLKKALIQATSYKQFEEILVFNLIPLGIIKEKDYQLIRDYIEESYLEFWDKILEYALKNNISLKKLFLNGNFDANYFTEILPYFNKHGWESLQEKISDADVTFIHSDLTKLHTYLNQSYDYMFLSNISDYLGIEKTRTLSKTKLMPFVKDEGEIAYAYMYDARPKNDYTLGSDDTLVIPSVIRQNENYDLVLTLKKR